MANDSRPEWRALLSGANAGRTLVLVSGVGLHAINIFIATTILPSVVADIGGLPYYAWNTTLFVVTSIIGSAASATALNRLAPRAAYFLAVTFFAFGTAGCAVALNMPMLLAGRSLQGFGGGMLVALSYAMIRHLFAVALWPRAIALVSGMWGAAALTGPFVGGVFAELGVWRAAFWVLLPLAGGYVALCGHVLGRRAAGKLRVTKLPLLRLVLLAAAVLSVLAGSLSANFRWNAAGAAGAAVLTAALAYLDRTSPERLLPRDLFQPTTSLGATYAAMVLLVTGTTTIIFVPLLLQVLHGLSALAAGYLTVIEALGWTGAALATSAVGQSGARQAVAAGPVAMLVGLVGLSRWIPDYSASLVVIAVCLALVGAGVGMGWSHLASRVVRVAPDDERDLAAASISTVQLLATAFGSALAGMVVNLAGLIEPGSAGGAANAARWLFAVFTSAPALAGIAVWFILIEPAEQSRSP